MNYIKLIVNLLILLLCQYCFADTANGYYTNGIGSLEKCKKFGIQLCNSEKIGIPTIIDSSSPSWAGVYHNDKKDGSSICWFKVKNGAFTEETLSFDCKPIK